MSSRQRCRIFVCLFLGDGDKIATLARVGVAEAQFGSPEELADED